MTTPNRELAGRAKKIAKGSDGLRRRAAGCVALALSETGSIAAARRYLEAIERPDLHGAAVAVLDELTADEQAV